MADDPTSWGAIPAESPEAWGAVPMAAPRAEPSATWGSLAKQVAVGIPAGIIDTAGTMSDIFTARGLARQIMQPALGEQTPPTTAEAISASLPAAIDPESYPARNAPERIARGVGAALPGVVLGPLRGAGELAGNVATQAISGGTGAAAQEMVPDWAKPIAGFVGGLLGGVGTAGTIAAGRAVPGAIKRAAEPFTTAGQERLAAQSYFGSADNLPAVRTALEADTPEIVPGSVPTTGQATGDMGLLARERGLETTAPVPFQQRRAEQNAARRASLGEVAPTGSPEDLAGAFQARLGAIDAETQAAVDRATTEAQRRTSGLGGDLPAEAYGEAIRGAIEPRVEAQRGVVRQAVSDLGGTATPEASGQALRGALDAAESSARASERQLWNAVDPDGSLTYGMQPIQQAWQTVYAGLTRAAEATMAPAERTIASLIEGYGGVEPFRELTDLRSLVSSAMRQELVTNGRTPAYARLSRFRGAIEDDITQSVARRAEQEAQAVAAGQIAPEQTMLARLQAEADAWRSEARGSAAASAGEAAPTRAPVTARASRTEGPAGGGPEAAAGDHGVSPTWDAGAAERLATATAATRGRAQTFNAPALRPILRREGQSGPFKTSDADVAKRVFAAGPGGGEMAAQFLSAAGPEARGALVETAVASMLRAARREDGTIDPAKFMGWRKQHADALRVFPELDARMQTVARASALVHAMDPIGRTTNAALPSQFFRPGETGGEAVRSLRGLIGDERALPILSDYAAASARRAAERSDGTIDPTAFARWSKNHAAALDELPGEVSSRFGTAAKASEAIRDAATARKQAIDDYQAGAIGKVLKVSDAADVTKTVGGLFGKTDSAAQIARLAGEARREGPAAVEGLRRAVADHITSKLVSNTEAGTSGVTGIKPDMFQAFVRQNRTALSKIFGPGEMARLDAIAADLQRANRSVTAVKLPGRSNTPQDIRLAAEAGGPQQSALVRVISALMTKPIKGVLGAVDGVFGTKALDAFNSAGIANVDDLIRKMALEPEFAKVMLSKLPTAGAKVSDKIGAQFAQRVLRASAASGVEAVEERERKKRADGGRVNASHVDPDPTEAQKEAGNYRKASVNVHGFPISIENVKGSERSGVGKDGKPWSVKMPAHYGYFRRSEGADGDHVDVYLGPHLKSPHVFIIDQKNSETGRFDEHKVGLGFASRKQFEATYLRAFSDGKGHKRLGHIAEMDVPTFKEWLKTRPSRSGWRLSR